MQHPEQGKTPQNDVRTGCRNRAGRYTITTLISHKYIWQGDELVPTVLYGFYLSLPKAAWFFTLFSSTLIPQESHRGCFFDAPPVSLLLKKVAVSDTPSAYIFH